MSSTSAVLKRKIQEIATHDASGTDRKKTKLNPSDYDSVNGSKANYDHAYVHEDPSEYWKHLAVNSHYHIVWSCAGLFMRIVRSLFPKRDSTFSILDVGCSYGFNATRHKAGLTFHEVGELVLDRKRVNEPIAVGNLPVLPNLTFYGLDISAPALRWAEKVGLHAGGWSDNLEVDEPSPEFIAGFKKISLVYCTGCIGYVTVKTFEKLLKIAQPTFVFTILRCFDSDNILDLFKKAGYNVWKSKKLIFQRGITSQAERDGMLESLKKKGITDYEDYEGAYNALFCELWVLTPPGSTAKIDLNRIHSRVIMPSMIEGGVIDLQLPGSKNPTQHTD